MNEFNFNGKATLLRIGTFGIVKTVVREISVKNTHYAQYNNALRINLLQPRKRKHQGCTLSYKPWCVIIEGDNIPEPKDAMEKFSEIATITRYAAFSEEWNTEANQYIEQLQSMGYKVLFDHRTR